MKDREVSASVFTKNKVNSRANGLAVEHTAENRKLFAVFSCLMLTVLLSSTNVTMVSPAMPRIVAELGGMEFYSWIVVAALIPATVLVPIVGKLSDLYGRKPFYLGGIVVFLVGSVLSGLAPNFWSLIAARAVQGIALGIMPPLSQAIMGDMLSPRERGKYQGALDVTVAVSSLAGPLIGGLITDHFSWRWLFFVNVPLGVIIFIFIARVLQLPRIRRSPSIDYRGIISLTIAVTALLLGVSLGGSQFAWDSLQVISLMLGGVASLFIFVLVEKSAKEPMLPPDLWRNGVFTLSTVANAMIGMAFYAGIYFLPVYVQGVLGASATNSGVILVPMMLSLTFMSIVSGQLVARTGRYKPVTVVGMMVGATGFLLLARMDVATPYYVALINMVIVGAGLGAGMQTFTLIVQNAVDRKDLGVATATTLLFRSIGRTAGTAILGTILTQRMSVEIGIRLPEGSMTSGGFRSATSSAGAVIDPALLPGLPEPVVEAVREGLSMALQSVFWAVIPAMVIALISALLTKEIPLSTEVGAGGTQDVGDGEPAEIGKRASRFDVG